MSEDISNYEDLIKNHGVTIPDLLCGNSGNVGDIGELLIIAANEIERLESLKINSIKSMLVEIGEYLHYEEFNNGKRLDALNEYFKIIDYLGGDKQ